MDVLDLPMPTNDAKAATVRAYLLALLTTVWTQEEGFSGKRPFGNSGWQHDVYRTLVLHKAVPGKLDEDGHIEDVDTAEADKIVIAAIAELY